MKYIKRLLGFPFVFGVLFVHSVFSLLTACYLFLRYGGEMNTYNKNINARTIRDVYEKIAKNENN